MTKSKLDIEALGFYLTLEIGNLSLRDKILLLPLANHYDATHYLLTASVIYALISS